ncbi:MAG: hypothetical protein PVH68_05350 [Armatimonadota bacterium]
MILIIIIILTFLGALGSLMQAVLGQPVPFCGTVATGAAARLVGLVWGLVAAAVGVGLLLMTRWGWWLAIIECAASALTGVLSIPHMDALVSAAMQNQPFPPTPDMMDMMEGITHAIMAMTMIFSILLQFAIVGYLVWKRDLFGIDVEPESATR